MKKAGFRSGKPVKLIEFDFEFRNIYFYEALFKK